MTTNIKTILWKGRAIFMCHHHSQLYYVTIIVHSCSMYRCVITIVHSYITVIDMSSPSFTVIVCHRCVIIIVHSCIMSSVSSSFTVVLCHRCVITIVHSCSMYRCVITIIHSYINVIDMSSPSFTVVVCHRCVIIVHSCIMSSVSLSSFTVVLCHRCVITIVHSCSMS